MNNIKSAAEFTRQNELSKSHTEMANTVEQLRRCLLRAGDPAWNEVVDSLIFAVEERTKKAIRDAGIPVSNV